MNVIDDFGTTPTEIRDRRSEAQASAEAQMPGWEAVKDERDVTFEPVRPAPLPWSWAAKTLPPHDVLLFAADGQVIARWDGETLDETGQRQRVEEDFARICIAINGVARTGHARACIVCGAAVGQPCVMTSDHDHSSDPNLEPDERLRGLKKGDVRPISHFYR